MYTVLYYVYLIFYVEEMSVPCSDLSGGTLELLFELYDRSDGNFLGLGIVGIEELVATPSQRQIIPLQSRPYENDNVSGSLTVEVSASILSIHDQPS